MGLASNESGYGTRFGEDCPAARAVAELARLIEEGWPELDPAYREKSCPPLAEAVATFREASSVPGRPIL